jgi:putative nuclease YbcO-like protein
MRRRSPMKGGRTKSTPARRAARMQDCTIELALVCNYRPETVVLCHSNKGADGKGYGLKARDDRAAFGCCACHDVVDRRVPLPLHLDWADVERAFDRGTEKTVEILRRLGVLT